MTCSVLTKVILEQARQQQPCAWRLWLHRTVFTGIDQITQTFYYLNALDKVPLGRNHGGVFE